MNIHVPSPTTTTAHLDEVRAEYAVLQESLMALCESLVDQHRLAGANFRQGRMTAAEHAARLEFLRGIGRELGTTIERLWRHG